MRITHFDRKLGEMKLHLETLEDLWHLERVLRKGDRVESRTLRSVKFGEGKEEKKPVRILLEMENVEFAEFANRLRVNGKIIEGSPEDFVQIGRYHTLDLEPGSKVKIVKNWKNYEVKRIEKAVEQSKRPLVRIIVMDENDATTAILRGYGITYGPELSCSGSKREGNYEEKVRQYYGEIASYLSKHPEKFIVAGPGFAKDGLKDFIREKYPELLDKVSFESCSTSEKSGVNELLKRGVVAQAVGEAQLEQEEKLIEEFIMHLHKDDGLAAYGIEEVNTAVEARAVEKLLVLDESLRKDERIEEIAEKAEKIKSGLVFFSAQSDAGHKLKGFGGIAALLRFRIS
ncbi:mRNA surveillance protein pelota [Candidatus Micrarchaeota archaeon]|nr:mRNA surveillance protein pelota [Candidatus Micrarchaeota archaeon]MBD3417648.1 mRNA surveillance protein pelota [Candidatus Micrarchaeota archaeon]